MEGQVTDIEQEVIITSNYLLHHFSDHNRAIYTRKNKTRLT